MQDSKTLIPLDFDIATAKPETSEPKTSDIIVTALRESAQRELRPRLPAKADPEIENCRNPTNERMQTDLLSVRRGLRSCTPAHDYDQGEFTVGTTRIRRERLAGGRGNAPVIGVKGSLHF